MKFLSGVSAVFMTAFIFSGCNVGGSSEKESDLTVEITKWFEGRTFALSVNLDGGALDFRTENNWLIEQELFLDYEIVSLAYDEQHLAREYLFDTLGPHGFGYFGHGHAHINHDALGYEGAYASFKLNYDRMKAYGLTPVSYAYPEGMGLLGATQKAVQDAGFFAARSFQENPDGFGPHIMPGDAGAPRNWFHLPTLRMEDAAATGCHEGCTNDSEEFREHLNNAEARGSWLISTYHSIGYDGQTDGRPVGWGYYKRQNFYTDMTRVRQLRDAGTLWLARMDNVVRYTRQRQATRIRITNEGEDSYLLHLAHDLDPAIFDHQMTVRFKVSSQYAGKTLHVYRDEGGTPYATVKSEEPEFLLNLPPSQTPYRLEFIES